MLSDRRYMIVFHNLLFLIFVFILSPYPNIICVCRHAEQTRVLELLTFGKLITPVYTCPVGDTKLVIKKKEPIPMIDSKEPIQLSKFPDAQKPDEGRTSAIEREDWPAPPAPAAAFPELLREKKKGRSGRRSTTTSGAETTDTEIETEISEWEDEPDSRPVDPKIQREIDYLLKHGGTGAARAFLRELERKGAESPTLDPVSASRTPSADHEPHYKLRYPNPVFASPSRDTEFRPRLYSLDDHLVGRKYRSTTQTVGNFPVPRPGYGLAPPSSTHSTADSREAGYFSDTGFVRHTLRRERMFDRDGDTTDGEMTDKETLERRSFYSSQSSFEEYDPTTGLRRSKLRSSTVSSEGLSTPYLGYKRIGTSLLKAEAPPQVCNTHTHTHTACLFQRSLSLV
ncbi:hypothetical protein LSH36_496g02039 [Paralvinella palmiformis]|uniref:Uncharacterized protein n=1 Tax=Paralvinella palmiformis TaxID=53620 RepID=A0AAD9J8K6_9ANNE|nr:hypothetical protein LSH36_496g02039 [Paralvinella palmiformis]